MANSSSPLPDPAAGFDPHAITIAKRQYFQEGDHSLEHMFRRVANWVAQPEGEGARDEAAERFYQLMISKRFCPGGRVLAGADTLHGNVLNCFVQDGGPEVAGTSEWVLHLATKLALVTKVGGGNGVNLDPLGPKRRFSGHVGRLYLTIDPRHADYEKVRTGTFLDLVRGEYVTRGYRSATFVERGTSNVVRVRTVGDSVDDIWGAAADMVKGLLDGQDVLVDLSDLRPEGTPVAGSGGTSSGPSSFAVEVFDNFAIWAGLGGAGFAGPVATLRYVFSPTLRAIRQGGTRRGAGMATLRITHPDIKDFVTAKDLEREQTEGDISTFNISVLVTDEFMERSKNERQGQLYEIAQHAWATGEPGLIYIDRINEFNPMRAELGDILSTNPCVTADTWVHTQHGAKQVHQLVGKEFCAYADGVAYPTRSNGFFSTGVKPVFELTTTKGFKLSLTDNHKLKRVVSKSRAAIETEWVELKDLVPGDELVISNHRGVKAWGGLGTRDEGWLLGMLVGDGTFATDKPGIAHLDLWGEERGALADVAAKRMQGLRAPLPGSTKSEREDRIRLSSRALGSLAQRFGVVHRVKTVTDEIEGASYEFVVGFLRGLFDADGSVQGSQAKGVSVRLAQSDLNTLERVQRMLARIGVISTVYEQRRPEGTSRLPDGKGGMADFAVKAQHELVIALDNLQVFSELVGFEVKSKQDRLAESLAAYVRTPNRERFVDTIRSIEATGQEEVFDVTVDHVHAFDANGIVAHNCGEIPLYPGEPCDLGALNLAAYVKERGRGLSGYDFDGFAADVATSVRFLDNVLDVNKFALEDNRDMSMKLRRLGLGVMGLADALILMGYGYDSEEGRDAVEAMIGALRNAAEQASRDLAKERGAFPLFAQSDLETPRRNVAVLTVAPTGTTSMLMGVSSGVEPVFAPFIYRKIGTDYHALIHPLFQQLLEEHQPHAEFYKDGGWDWEKVVGEVQANHGSVQGLAFIPQDVQRVLRCAHDIAPADHVKMQGAVQRAFDGGERLANSISKTINLPNQASVDDVFESYSLAFSTGCKGITVYRDGSRDFQVLSTSAKKSEKKAEPAVAPAAAASGSVAPSTASAAPAPVAPPMPAEAPRQSGMIAVATTAQAATAQTNGRNEYLPGEPLFERPIRLSGFTDSVKLMLPTGEKRGFFVTVNKQDELPTEVFIVSGKAGDEANADSEALGRVVSIALQYGVPAEALIKTLRGINGGMYGTYHGRLVASKADLLAVALETAGAENVLNKGRGCPDCGAPLRFEEGCEKCESCGYSKCG